MHKTFTRQGKTSDNVQANSEILEVNGGNTILSEAQKNEAMTKIVDQKSVLEQSKAQKSQQAREQGLAMYKKN